MYLVIGWSDYFGFMNYDTHLKAALRLNQTFSNNYESKISAFSALEALCEVLVSKTNSVDVRQLSADSQSDVIFLNFLIFSLKFCRIFWVQIIFYVGKTTQKLYMVF